MSPGLEAHYVTRARYMVRDAAMLLARAGVADETIRESLRELAEEEADAAIAWGSKEDSRQSLADADHDTKESR